MSVGATQPGASQPPGDSAAPRIKIYVPTPFRRLTSGEARVDAVGATIAGVIEDLERRYPGFRELVWADGDILHYVNVYLNGEEIRGLQGSASPLSEGDEVAFVPMLAGGKCA
ncbi:MAG TPA: MoaD/ThiS family protein [Chloroflexota bacterium]|nr:MoaD/ThiS family protein [Chloroflexota bacterium]